MHAYPPVALRLRARLPLKGFFALAFAISLSGCTGQAGGGESSWVLPFESEEPNGCASIATPFSVANPWDHAHEGLDFACVPGTTVLAVAEGVVTSVERVEVRGENRYRLALTVAEAAVRVEYANLRAVFVSPGDSFRAGDPIGESAMGFHLAVWSELEGRYVDPGDYLPLDALVDAP